MNPLTHLSTLSDEALLARIYELARSERLTTVDQVCNFAEMCRRKLDAELAFSVFTFCHEELRMPESTAYRYHCAAGLVLRFPAAVEYLRDGRLNPSTLNKLHDVLTEENHVELFNRASGLSQKKTDLLLAELNPKPDVKETVTFVPERTPKQPERPLFIDRKANPSAPSLDLGFRASPPTSAAEVATQSSSESIPVAFSGPGAVLAELFRPSISIEPLRPGHFVVRINCDQQMLDDIEEARFALSHVMPKANKAEIIHECVRRTLQTLAQKQRGALKPHAPKTKKKPSKKENTARTQPVASTSAAEVTAGSNQVLARTSAAEVTAASTQPVTSTSTAEVTTASIPLGSDSAARSTASATSLGGFNMEPGGAQYVPEPLRGPRELPAEVKRAVAERDGNRCAYVGPTGHRCNSRYKLTFDHSLEYANGGEPTVENTRQLCERHNKYTAIRTLGMEVMGKYLRSN